MGVDKKKSFLLYMDYKKHLLRLPDEMRGRLFLAIFDYADSGIIPDEKSELSEAALMAFSFIQAGMDRDSEKYKNKCKTNRSNGSMGGRPRKATETDRNQAKPKETDRFMEFTDDLSEDDATRLQKARDIYSGLPVQTRDAISKWLSYKKERREKYKPVGMLTLMTQVNKRVDEFGDTQVAQVILDSISSRYQGITWDRMQHSQRATRTSNPFADALGASNDES